MQEVMKYTVRHVGDVTIFDISGRISLGEALRFGEPAGVMLHDAIRDNLASGSRKILLNLREVTYVDSSGLGQLVGCWNSVCNKGGKLRISEPSPFVDDLLNKTKLAPVFDVQPNEALALRSFGGEQQKETTAA